MVRNIVAVVAGYVAMGLLVVATDQVFAAVIPGFKSMPMPPAYYFVISLITDSVYAAVGGYLCSRIAQPPHRNATLGLIIFGELMGVATTIVFWKFIPHWFSFALLILYPPAVWIGSRLRGHPTQANAAAT
jgi:hypothetical protein